MATHNDGVIALNPGSSKSAPALEGASQCYRIGVENTAAARNSEANSRDAHAALNRDAFLNIMAGGLALDVIGKGQHEFLYIAGFNTCHEARNVQVVGSNPVQGRKPSMQDVIPGSP